MVDWEKAWRSIVRLLLTITVILAGLGYFAFSRLAGWLPRWFPGQEILSSFSSVLGLVALAGLVVLVDWKKMWRKYKWQLVVSIELALLLLAFASGIYALIPGMSAMETSVQNIIHLKPLTVEIVSVQPTQEATASSLFNVQPKGELLVVRAKVTNTSKEPRMLWGHFELYDVQGRRFDRYPVSLLGGIDFCNPGLSSTATLVFDVPSAHGSWWLTVYPGPLSRLDGVTTAFLLP